MLIKNKLGIIWYLLGRNDWVWSKLSLVEKEMILGVNRQFNDQREDYLDSRDYGAGRMMGGENWENQTDRLSLPRGRIINGILEQAKPVKVLEIGPGPGFYTKTICQYNSVQEYVGVDVNQYFLKYLRVHLQNLVNNKDRFQFSLFNAEVGDIDYKNYFDLVVLISTVHHIPNRHGLFSDIYRMLKPGGLIVCIDPSHYFFRVLHLIKKMIFKGYLFRKYYGDLSNLSTHHMCTYGEYTKITRTNKLKIMDEWYLFPRRKIIRGHTWLRLFSQEIGILFKKYD